LKTKDLREFFCFYKNAKKYYKMIRFLYSILALTLFFVCIKIILCDYV